MSLVNTNSKMLVVMLSMILLSWGTFANFTPIHALIEDKEKDKEKDEEKDKEKDEEKDKEKDEEKDKEKDEEKEEKIMLCHIPPGNPLNQHQILVSESAIEAHVKHGDKIGNCNDDEEKKNRMEEMKKQLEKTHNNNELKQKLQSFKEIKKELKNSQKNIKDEYKQKIKTLLSDMKEILKKLKEDPDYDLEFKKLLKQELKETKLKIKHEMNTHESLSAHKIDSKISTLLKSDNPERDSKKLGLEFKDGKTKVVVTLADNDVEVFNKLKTIGKIDAKNDKQIQLTIKLNDLPKLRALQGIDKIRPPFSAVPLEESLSEGVYFMNADLAQYSGITGKGIKVAVFDLAFTNNLKISDNIVEVKSFRNSIGYQPIQGSGDEALHGTAVAEILVDVAPDVQLYLYAMESDIEFSEAVDEAISKKIDVIAMSAGWPNFPTDGTSSITKKIEEAVKNGIVFVVPAGNFGNKHWEGEFMDSNLNNWNDFLNTDEGLSIKVTESRIIEEKPIIVYLMWDVGLNDAANFELVLVDPLGQIVDYSINEQLTKSDTPFEYIHYIPDIEGIYSIGILNSEEITNPLDIPNAKIEIFTVNDELEYPIPESSVSVPADAKGAIVVGAVNHLDGKLAPYSSQGPTNNGMIAPHVVGPDGVTTLALNGHPFFGTSATTPYVAGLAALMLEKNPGISPELVLSQIQQNTEKSLHSLNAEYDYSIGYGAANAVFLINNSEVMQ